MGLNKGNGGNGGNILVVKRGGICRESNHEMEGFEHVKGDVDGEPYEKWIQKFGSVDGMVTDIKWYDTEDQYSTRYQGLKITIDDGDENFTLDLPYASKSYDAFTKFAENIDFSKPVEFIAYPDRENKDSTVFNAKQDGQMIRQKYTKAYVESGESDCPQAVENKRTGKWNFDAQRDWLLDNLLDNIVPKIANGSSSSAVEEPAAKDKTKGKSKAAAANEDRWAGVEDPIHGDD